MFHISTIVHGRRGRFGNYQNPTFSCLFNLLRRLGPDEHASCIATFADDSSKRSTRLLMEVQGTFSMTYRCAQYRFNSDVTAAQTGFPIFNPE